MANVKFYLATDKQDENGLCPIFLVFTYDSKRLRYYTKEKVSIQFWDKKKQKIKRGFDGYAKINDYLDSLSEKAKQCYREFVILGKIPSVSELKEKIKPKEDNRIAAEITIEPKIIFNSLFESFYTHNQLAGVSAGRLRHYKTFKMHLENFASANKYDLDITKYDFKIHDSFLHYFFYDLDSSPNNATKNIVILKKFFKYCREKENIELHKDTNSIKSKWFDVQRIFLTWNELMQMYSAELPENYDKIRDVFLFSCFTGLRYSDVEKLTPSHLFQDENGNLLIRLKQEKTSELTFSVNDYAFDIIEKYKEKGIERRFQKRLLPVQMNHKINLALKEIGKLAKIDSMVEVISFKNGEPFNEYKKKHELLTFHIARHTYAVISLQKGMPIEILQKQLGHKSIKDTMIYAKIVDSFRHKISNEVWKKNK